MKIKRIMITIGVVAVILLTLTYCVSKDNENNDGKTTSTTDSTTSTINSDNSSTTIKSELSTSQTSSSTSTGTTETETKTSTTTKTTTTKISSGSSTTSNGKKIVKTSDGLTYVDGILIANKTYSLPSDYAPGVNSKAQSALDKMISAASKDGIKLYVISSYRSYSKQSSLYNNYAANDGKAAADRYSARPGHSEHQTGYAFDLNSLSQSFENTPEGKWIAANCHKYGFILRYPKGMESVTGYMYEPWHVRYLGTDIATSVHNSGLCLESYLGITSEY